MSARLFFLPYTTATVNGIAQPGAQLFFYQTGTLTKLPIYTTDLLDVQQMNPVPASGAGRFPNIYLDSTQTYRLVVKDKTGAPLDDIDPYVPGTVEGLIVGNASATANTRTELAAMIGGAGSNALAFLSESGREGMFAWTTGDQSAFVTADTLQGIYVAPAADTTGAAGAWVRKFSGKADARWWGAFGDWNGSTGTGQAAAFNAALATLNALKTTTIYGYSKGSPSLYIPAQQLPYYINADIDVYHTLEIEWENGAGPSGGCAVWKCAAGVTGIRTHSNTSTGRNGETTNRGYSAVGTILRNPFMIGSFTTTEGEFYGIQMRVKTFIYDPYIEGFQGDGIFGDTSGVDNLNGSLVFNPFVTSNRDGIYINQNNANACQVYNPQPFSNRRFGIVCENGYGCSIFGGNSAGNGETTFTIYTQSFNNGHIFGVLYGQETWCSTNSPPATATSNQGWKYLYDIGAAQPQAIQWVTGRTWRAGGPIRITGGSTRGTISGHETETGQMPILLTGGGRVIVFGGLQGPGNPITETGALYGGFLDCDSSGFYVNGMFPTGDNAASLGTPSVRFTKVSTYRVDAKTWYALNGVDVLGPQKTGWTADTGTAKRTANASYAAGTTLTYSAAYVQAEQTAMATRVAAVEAALQNVSQTQKGIKDDLIGHGMFGA